MGKPQNLHSAPYVCLQLSWSRVTNHFQARSFLAGSPARHPKGCPSSPGYTLAARTLLPGPFLRRGRQKEKKPMHLQRTANTEVAGGLVLH